MRSRSLPVPVLPRTRSRRSRQSRHSARTPPPPAPLVGAFNMLSSLRVAARAFHGGGFARAAAAHTHTSVHAPLLCAPILAAAHAGERAALLQPQQVDVHDAVAPSIFPRAAPAAAPGAAPPPDDVRACDGSVSSGRAGARGSPVVRVVRWALLASPRSACCIPAHTLPCISPPLTARRPRLAARSRGAQRAHVGTCCGAWQRARGGLAWPPPPFDADCCECRAAPPLVLACV